MKRRDTERSHELADYIFDNANIFDLQGLLIGHDNEFTVAVEAFEMDEGETFNVKGAFSAAALRAKCTLASKLNIPFMIILHWKNTESFVLCHFAVQDGDIVEVSRTTKTEEEFIRWWAHRKGTNQKKGYSEMKPRIDDSYIDRILEKNKLKWGGNIDGFIVSKRDPDQILAIIEKRITAQSNIALYDPADFYDHRGGDFGTWKPVFSLSSQLQVPLFLLTFEHGNRTAVGAAIVKDVQPECLVYEAAPPNSNIFTNLVKLKRWMNQYI